MLSSVEKQGLIVSEMRCNWYNEVNNVLMSCLEAGRKNCMETDCPPNLDQHNSNHEPVNGCDTVMIDGT